MTKSDAHLDNPATLTRRSARKSTIWTREKISQLIELYHKSECLWNHYIEDYKNKELKNKSIDQICHKLGISKFEYGKKIHNLRNQFNSEMKKLERRVETSGGDLDSIVNGDLLGMATGPNNKRCRWEHFQALMFLHPVIEPRPGYHSSATTTTQYKKMRVKFNYTDDTTNPMSQTIDNSTIIAAPANSYVDANSTKILDNATCESYVTFETSLQSDPKEQPIPCQSSIAQQSTYNYPAGASTSIEIEPLVQHKVELLEFQPNSTNTTNHSITDAVTHLQTNNTNNNGSSSNNNNTNSNQTNTAEHPRDQWASFGELIANELRNLNSDCSRKKLKRKIMQAMLEVGAEDDTL